MTQPRIAYIASQYPRLSETFVHREVAGLRNRGWDIVTASLYAPEDPVEGEPAADRVVYPQPRIACLPAWIGALLRVPGRTARTLFRATGDALAPGEALSLVGRAKLPAQALAGSTVGHWFRQHEIKHVHCHFAHAPASVGMYAAMHAGISFSFTGHANDLFQRRALLKKKLQRAAFVACISDWHQQFYQSIAPDVTPRCRIVRCGVDLDQWAKRGKAREGNHVLHLITVARLMPKKGIDTLLRAAAQFAAQYYQPWRLDIYGDGPESERLQKLTQQLGLTEQVAFHGAVANERVRERLGEADLFVLPCRSAPGGDQDGIPVVLMEAMALGVPVIAGDVTALRELVAHERTGILTPPDEIEALNREMLALADDPDRRRRLAEEGRATVEQEFDLTKNLNRLEQAIRASIEARDATDHDTKQSSILSHQPMSR